METLDVGKATQAKLDNVVGLGPGDIVRIIRDRSIRLKFDPYYRFPYALTSIVGKVVPQNVPEMALEGVRIRLAKVNATDVIFTDVAGAQVAAVSAGSFAADIVLGSHKDVVTSTNQRGDYNFYFEKGKLTGEVTLEVSLAGYHTQTKTIAITELALNRADFELVKL
jgi:hypothetical protein